MEQEITYKKYFYEKYFDISRNLPYYYDLQKKESIWEIP